MEGSVLVIGGGIAGIQTSLDLTELGFKVYLIEKEASIGGHMAQFDKIFPANDCSLCMLAPKMVAVYKNPNIELFTLSEVKKVSGNSGNFKVSIIKNPRYVDETKCKGCGDCAAKCPKIEAPNIFDMNLGKRKSIYIPFPQATPPVYLIDPKLCLFLNREVCGVCKKVCKGEAIDFDQEPQEIEFNVGAIVVATGFDMLGEELSSKWGYQYKNVVNGLEYERILCPTGPFGTHILRPSDEEEPEKIAFIQCAGSGYLENHIPYCSRVCCMYTAKNAILTRVYVETPQITVFRHNIRVFGRDFYEYTKNAQEEYHIKYINSKIQNIEEELETNDLIIHYKDMKSRKDETYKANLVVLGAPLVPSKGTDKLAKILGIKIDQYNFLKSASYFDKSLSTKEGVYLCGFSQSPMNISETVANASAVASEVATLLSPVRYSHLKEREIDILPKEGTISINPRALVIGGGISGMTAALNLGNQGFETIILEKDKQLGGNINSINVLYPTKQSASDFLFNIEEEVRKNVNIRIFLNSKIRNITGSIGNYDVTLLDINNKIHQFRVGTIIIATGGQEFKPIGLFQYNEDNKNVLTLLELEKKLKDKEISWLNKLKHVSIILCVKARQKGGFSYCSNVCCSNAIKNIEILKEINPRVKILVLFRDLHMAKKELEELFSERKEIADYIRYDLENIPDVIKIGQNPEKYIIKLRDDSNPNNIIEFNTDLIVLATPMIPPNDLKDLSQMIDVPLDENGFFIEAHTKLRPLDFAGHGIFVCGCAQWPKNIQDCISQSNAAAGRASRFLSVKQISTTKLEYLSFMLSIQCFFKDMRVNAKKCNGCGRCAEVCQFKAISLTDSKQEYEDVSIATKKAIINPAICKGCGKCSATCRLKAIDARHYDFKQISAIIDPYFLEKTKPEEKVDEGAALTIAK
ncbi:MAG: FAD-dependent oxidoreductase [Promethearchaeota archaeon]